MMFNNFLTNNEEDKNRLSVLFWFNKAKKSKRTEQTPLYCRITLNGKRATPTGFSTNISIKSKTDWNSKLQCITAQTEEAKLQNERLQRIKLDIMQIFALLELAGKPFNALDIQNEYTGKAPQEAIHTLGDLLVEWEARFSEYVQVGEKRPRTLQSYLGYKQKVLAYFGAGKEIASFKNSDWEDFRLHIRSTVIKTGKHKGKCTSINTTAKVMGYFGTLFELAYRMEWVPRLLYALESAPRTKPTKIYLTTAQVKALQELHEKTKNEDLREAVGVFLFLSFTGFSYSDYCALSSDNFITYEGRQYIVKDYREKSPVLDRYGKSIVPIFAEAQAFLDCYQCNPALMPRHDSGIVNERLKIAWEIIGATPEMSLKNARKTFINYACTVWGLSEGEIASIVGHSSVRTTERSYLDRNIETIENALKRRSL